ncbi:MAG: amino acid ABC transporter permease [Leptolyngbyaceae bacterium]|nr:amino acid ABC transporter permease [Leptolyngbyaceae bacterium]
MLDSLSVIVDALPTLIQGALVTLRLTAIAAVLGIIGGTALSLIRLSSLTPLSFLARVYVDFFRGTPLLVQIFLIYFGFPALIQSVGLEFSLNKFAAAILALSLNTAAYSAEVMRAGIQSIEPGQWEAGKSLGLNPLQSLRHIILPQAFRRMIPPLGNEFIILLKDTSLVAVIGYEELFRRGQLIVANNYKAFQIYISVALVYLVLTLLASQVVSFLEWWADPLARQKNPKFRFIGRLMNRTPVS